MTASDYAIIIGAVFAGVMALAQWYGNFQLAKIKATSEAALESSKRNAVNIQEAKDTATAAASHAEVAVQHAAVAVETAQSSAKDTKDKMDEVAKSINGRMEEIKDASFAAGVQSERDKQ